MHCDQVGRWQISQLGLQATSASAAARGLVAVFTLENITSPKSSPPLAALAALSSECWQALEAGSAPALSQGALGHWALAGLLVVILENNTSPQSSPGARRRPRRWWHWNPTVPPPPLVALSCAYWQARL